VQEAIARVRSIARLCCVSWTSEHEQTQAAPRCAPPASVIAAAVSLLVDPDARVVTLCRRQVLAWDHHALAQLRQAADGDDPHLRVQARALLRTLELRHWVRGMERFVNAVERAVIPAHRDHRVLEIGALLIAALGRVHGVDRRGTAETLQRYAEELSALVSRRPRTAMSSARALREVVVRRHGLTCQLASRYDASHAWLDHVVQTRLGDPVLLAILYLVIGRRAGMCLTAVMAPDRLLVRVHGTRSVLLDPTRGGRTVSNADCIRDLRARGYSGRRVRLEEIDDRQLLLCLLQSLRRVYGYREDSEVLRALARAVHLLEG
jgi:regulator of sirC expression with transglutaminase-like and TPR domain